jgi:DNA-binding CsgD family transcriptional regulator
METLTPRQTEVLLLYAHGRSWSEMTRDLGITRWTLYHHAEAIRERTGAANMCEAVWLMRHELDEVRPVPIHSRGIASGRTS